ncbi:MAG: type IX secretion system sortase PorU [Chlorobi bacterium]|nr:type IX secretion system sortase PorU [Chlorobiota bacterium]
MLHKKIIFSLFLLITWISGFSITYNFSEKIEWTKVEEVTDYQNEPLIRLAFEGGVYQQLNPVPYFVKMYPVHTSDATLSVMLTNVVTAPLTPEEINVIKGQNRPDTSFISKVTMSYIRKSPYAKVKIIPVRWNKNLKAYEKLLSFNVEIEVEDIESPRATETLKKTSSVLATGDWFKVKIDKSGIFKITYQELQEMGFDVSGNPRNIAVYGNGGGILPEKNDDFRYDDLVENPIVVAGESDGKFDPSDYILFYGEGPVLWKYNKVSGAFFHQNNYYDDYSYYFITLKTTPGKRIAEAPEPDGPVDFEVSDFLDYDYHEEDLVNIAGTGRTWYGELFDFNSTYEFTFSFPNLISSKDAFLRSDFASVSATASQFLIYVNGTLQSTVPMPTIPVNSPYQKGKEKSSQFPFFAGQDQLTVKLVYQRSSNNASSYLNFIELNVPRKLKMAGDQMMFRKPQSDVGIARYTLSNAANGVTIWDITVPVNPRKVKTVKSGNNLVFKASSDTLRQFIAFTGKQYYQATPVGKVGNQNLHAVSNVDYLIVAYPEFLDEARRLAQFHAKDGMSVYVTTPQKIYNEFSSGSQDITAIRDFAKHLYDYSDAGKELKYLLLFGDASYDYKDKINDNTNYVPCWESIRSLNIVWSVASDDYYGYLDDGEGVSDDDNVDIGIGRFVVINAEEAKTVVDKVINYGTNTKKVMAPWRNIITFLADDGDNNLHLKHAETIVNYIEANDPIYNIDKIYVDAYQQISTPSGQQAPGVNKAVTDRIEKGTLIFNYSGHGGEIGLGHERFLEIADIESWENYDRLPIFITATCEFSRFDDPTRISAGEITFLSDHGGAIAMFSTSRATFASANLALNMAIFKNNIFSKVDGQDPAFGDVIRRSKILGGDNDKKFVLLGDPALKLAYTKYRVETTKINRVETGGEPDTLRALSKVRVEGVITDQQGNTVPSYNGILYPLVFDKKSEIKTLGDDNPVYTFYVRKNILFNGKATISNGQFNFEFIVPKDIAYKFGDGRISYYLNNDYEDGAGYYEGVIIGGYDETAVEDVNGPEIRLYMNDTTFNPGDITDQNPVMLARVWDESGINTTGNGIGHDIIAVLDGDDSKTFTLNQFYEADENSYNSGSITYPFKALPSGKHILSLKIWDIYNNSSTAQLEFTVMPSENVTIENLMNYPNPFSDVTNFIFDHNQSGQDLNVKINIYTVSGALVTTLETVITPEGYRSPPITWNATNGNGAKISRGFYIYQVIVRNQNGSTAEKRGKMVFIR